MQHIKGISNNQIQLGSLEDRLSADELDCIVLDKFWEQP
jgi:hypothetical protein